MEHITVPMLNAHLNSFEESWFPTCSLRSERETRGAMRGFIPLCLMLSARRSLSIALH